MGKPVNFDQLLDLQVSDVSGQKRVNLRQVTTDATVGELIAKLLGQMHLPPNDPEGRPVAYHARLEREGRHLHASERIGDALEQNDELVLQPNIDAGLHSHKAFAFAQV